ncbi:MAG: hypothetical protein R3C28_16545 [Pirellulaceae bacterium]
MSQADDSHEPEEPITAYAVPDVAAPVERPARSRAGAVIGTVAGSLAAALIIVLASVSLIVVLLVTFLFALCNGALSNSGKSGSQPKRVIERPNPVVQPDNLPTAESERE